MPAQDEATLRTNTAETSYRLELCVEGEENPIHGTPPFGPARVGRPGGKHPVPDTEVSSKARRRIFSARYKLDILAAVEAAREFDEIGALLRREGLYSSHLTKWKAQRKAGVYKNPCSHRDVRMEHLDAFVRLVVASDLLKIIDQAGE